MGPCSVAVLKGGVIVSSRLLLETHQQVKMLMPMVEETMREAELTYGDLDAIAVGIGPGSFTGIRIGMAAAHGFALAGNIPLIGISTLESMAFAANHSGVTGAIMHAGKGQYYCQWFDGTPPRARSEAILCLPEEVRTNAPPEASMLVGNAAAEFSPALPESKATDITFPEAQYIARLAAARDSAGVAHLEPLYIRPPDAKPSQR